MKNFELKAVCVDSRGALKAVKMLKASYKGILIQRDVYFNISPGRLKLRSINESIHQLIYYKRSNRAMARFSNYYICEIKHPKRVEDTLSEIYGIKVIVSKRRKLYLWQNVRIHFDTVRKLGKFIEFEIVCRSKIQETKSAEKMRFLYKFFNITKESIINTSYSDMLF